jgi:hypothetical protein
LLSTMRNDHVAALSQKLVDLRNILQPVIGSVPREAAQADSGSTWQENTEKVFIAAQGFDETLNREIAGNPAEGSGFGNIAKALGNLDAKASIFTRR